MNFLDKINIDNWEEEFDDTMTIKKDFGRMVIVEKDDCDYVFKPEIMKRFIRKILESQKEEFKEIVDEMIGEEKDFDLGWAKERSAGYNKKRQEIIDIAKKYKII